METSFTPGSGLLGGILIGLAASALFAASGKIAGISGILGRSFFPAAGDLGWRLAFLLGLPLGALLVERTARGSSATALAAPSPFAITDSLPLLIAAGLLVGYGTQLGNGCTSGHGVCGLARGAKRSLAATATFIATAALTVFLMRHVARLS